MLKILMVIVGGILFFTMSIITASPVLAQSSQTSTTYTDSTGRNQWRYIYWTGDETWTKYKALGEQPTKGTYCKKGNGLFWYDKGGVAAELNISVGFSGTYKKFSVGSSLDFSVSLGKKGTVKKGMLCKASSSGYYKLYVKKKIKPSAVYIQKRSYVYDYPYGYKWTQWSTGVYSKKYKVIQVRPLMKKISK